MNGIMNAIDAMPNGGIMTIILAPGGSGHRLTIADTGTGVEADIIPRVFDPFFTTKGSKGTGLGLFVSYNIIQAHQGTLELLSPEGKGARLIITLPVASGAKLTPAPSLDYGKGI
jgi:signal transduction histidine kinase